MQQRGFRKGGPEPFVRPEQVGPWFADHVSWPEMMTEIVSGGAAKCKVHGTLLLQFHASRQNVPAPVETFDFILLPHLPSCGGTQLPVEESTR